MNSYQYMAAVFIIFIVGVLLSLMIGRINKNVELSKKLADNVIGDRESENLFNSNILPYSITVRYDEIRSEQDIINKIGSTHQITSNYLENIEEFRPIKPKGR